MENASNLICMNAAVLEKEIVRKKNTTDSPPALFENSVWKEHIPQNFLAAKKRNIDFRCQFFPNVQSASAYTVPNPCQLNHKT